MQPENSLKAMIAVGIILVLGALPRSPARAQELVDLETSPDRAFPVSNFVYGVVTSDPMARFAYRYYGHPFDDSYDPPLGYGEYAEYGPWAYRRYARSGCQWTQARVWMNGGLRRRMVRICY